MPRYIIKPDKNQDVYIEWSTIVDAPVAIGPRSAFEAEERGRDRLDRAERTGTSALWGSPPYLGWDDKEFILSNGEWDMGGQRTIKRRDLIEYTYAEFDGDYKTCERLTMPINYDD